MTSIRPLIVIAVCIGMYYFYISPTLLEVRALSVKKAEYYDVLEKTKELKTKRDSLLNDYGNIPGTEIERLNKIIPETFNSVIFANDVNNLASKHRLIMKEFKASESKTEVRDPSVSNPKDKYQTTVVNIRMSGGYEDFIAFLTDLELNLHLSDVVTLVVQSSDRKGSGASMDYTLELNTYSLR